MKPINIYAVLVYNTGNPKSANTVLYRFNVGAKSEKEAEKLIVDWLSEHKLTARTRTPRTLCLEKTISLKYKEVQQVYPKPQPLT